MNFTRESLYELVWSKPISSIAKEYNILDYVIRKICKKYEIPIPKLGHWQKLQHGKQPEKEKLSPSEKWKDVEIKLSDRDKDVSTNPYLIRLSVLAKDIEKKHPKLILVPDRLTNPDPMIVAVKPNLESKKGIGWNGLKVSVSNSANLLSISVGEETIPRALRFMDAFIKLSKARGHQWEISRSDTQITINGEKYGVRCREKTNRIVYEKNNNWDRSELVPNGILSLKLDNLHDKEWKDGKIPLEKQLSKIMAAFELKAEDDKIRRAEIEAYWEERDRINTIQKLELAKQEWEEKKGDVLKQFAEQWNRSQQIKTFIDALESNPQEKTDKVIEWIKWAREQQKKMDPLSGGLGSFVDKFDFKPQ